VHYLDKGTFGYHFFLTAPESVLRAAKTMDRVLLKSRQAMEKDLPAGANPENLPSRDYIFEFTLTEGEKGFVAADIDLVYKY